MKTNNLNSRQLLLFLLSLITLPAFGMQQQRRVRFADGGEAGAFPDVSVEIKEREMQPLLRASSERKLSESMRASRRVEREYARRVRSEKECDARINAFTSRHSFKIKVLAATAVVGWIGFCRYLTKDLTEDDAMVIGCLFGAIKPWDCNSWLESRNKTAP